MGRAAGCVAHVKGCVLIEEGGFDLFRHQAMFRDAGGVAALIVRIIPIDQGIP
jgi:hypothetical protein